MASAELAVQDHVLDRLGQAEQAQGVGNVAAALADRLGQHLLGVMELVHQAPVALRLFDRREVLALHVLDDGRLEGLLIR
jgi:hypothetical protein